MRRGVRSLHGAGTESLRRAEFPRPLLPTHPPCPFKNRARASFAICRQEQQGVPMVIGTNGFGDDRRVSTTYDGGKPPGVTCTLASKVPCKRGAGGHYQQWNMVQAQCQSPSGQAPCQRALAVKPLGRGFVCGTVQEQRLAAKKALRRGRLSLTRTHSTWQAGGGADACLVQPRAVSCRRSCCAPPTMGPVINSRAASTCGRSLG